MGKSEAKGGDEFSRQERFYFLIFFFFAREILKSKLIKIGKLTICGLNRQLSLTEGYRARVSRSNCASLGVWALSHRW